MRIHRIVAGVGGLVLSLFAASLSPVQAQEAAPAPRIDSENRLFVRFIEDAAIVPSYWLEGQANIQFNTVAFDEARGAGEADTLTVGPVFALNVAEDFEFGGRLGFAWRDPDPGGSDTGLTDMDLWGKLSLVSDPLDIALGISVALPTGDEDKFLGSGETTVAFFAAGRKNFQGVAITGNVGVRINQDFETEDLDLEGQNSLLAGAAVLFAAGERTVLSLEYALETERFDGLKNDSRLAAGFDFSYHSSLQWRGAVVFGLSDGAPDTTIIGSAVWLF